MNLAYCGIDCEKCDAFIATRTNNYEMKKKMAEEASKDFSKEIKPEDINCYGCTSEGKHIGYCAVCGIRKCAVVKKVSNCAYCEGYINCDTLNNFIKNIPAAKENLESLRKK